MAGQLINHTCSAYCVPPRHCTESLARPDLTAADVRQGWTYYVEPYGWKVVDVREAREADVGVWYQTMNWGMDHTDGYMTQPGALPPAAKAWLVFIEPLDGQETEPLCPAGH